MTLIRRTPSGTLDEYNNDVLAETRVTVYNCVFVPAGSFENTVLQDQVSTTDTIFMPAGTVVTALDAIEYDGDVYEINGEPSAWTSPFSGRVSPIRINVSRISGVAA
jgi:hypothetical protein